MTKLFFSQDEYLNIIKQELDLDQQEIMNNQINMFYEIKDLEIPHKKYNIGDYVILKKNSYIHGVRNVESINIFKSIKKHGLISNTFRTQNKQWKVNYCMSFFHINEQKSLQSYIDEYSGYKVTYNKKTINVPYSKIDKFLLDMKTNNNTTFHSEEYMETLFLPNIAKDSPSTQYALILYAESNKHKKIFNNILTSKINNQIKCKFFHTRNTDKGNINPLKKESKNIAYTPFGVPSNLIEGILIGRTAEKNISLLHEIKTLFPTCYICNLDGIVIL